MIQPQKNAEALELVQRAIRIFGPVPSLLGTRGVIHLNGGRAEQAIKDLEEAIAESPTADRWLYLAQAHQLAKDRAGAMTALTEAHRLGLTESGLHPLERAGYQQLCVQLAVEKR